jgi:hypothetical protein
MQPAFVVVVLLFAPVAPIAALRSIVAGPPTAAAPTPTEVWAVPWEPPPSAPPLTVLSPLRTTAANVDMPRIRLAIELAALFRTPPLIGGACGAANTPVSLNAER